MISKNQQQQIRHAVQHQMTLPIQQQIGHVWWHQVWYTINNLLPIKAALKDHNVYHHNTKTENTIKKIFNELKRFMCSNQALSIIITQLPNMPQRSKDKRSSYILK